MLLNFESTLAEHLGDSIKHLKQLLLDDAVLNMAAQEVFDLMPASQARSSVNVKAVLKRVYDASVNTQFEKFNDNLLSLIPERDGAPFKKVAAKVDALHRTSQGLNLIWSCGATGYDEEGGLDG
jgi:hypothetical protein